MNELRWLSGYCALAVLAASGCVVNHKASVNPAGQSGSAGAGDSNPAGGSSGDGSVMLPPDFTATQMGGFKLGPPVDSGDGGIAAASDGGDAGTAVSTDAGMAVDGSALPPGKDCGTVITGIVRDFKGANEPGGHPDFEAFQGHDPSLGIVLPDLGSDQRPVYSADGPFIDQSVNGDDANGQQTTSKADFDQWYRNTPGVNKPYIVSLYAQPNGGVFTFQSDAFFPIDGVGWGNTPGQEHNFSFTTEVHTQFKYTGGEAFTFTGDDDLWVFINRKLAIDLGGLHAAASKSVSLDEQAHNLDLVLGNTYPLDLFHAERHTTASDFRIDSNLKFTDCGSIVPDGRSPQP